MNNKFSLNNMFDSTHPELKREELEVSLLFPLIGGVVSTIVFALLVGSNVAYINQLLTGIPATRNIVLILIFLSMAVIIFNIIKIIKVQKQFKKLRQKNIIPEDFDLKSSTTDNITDLIENNLSDPGSLISIRCRRILQAYKNPQTKKAASDIALDDSSFYQDSSVASYSLPRTAIWAIPLIGFIGTVWGIGEAIGGFSGFLGSTGGEEGVDTQQLQIAINNVTTNLATAFETTLVALVLSVFVMMFLTVVQNKEFRLLRRIDIYIGQRILAQLEGDEYSTEINQQAIKKVIYKGLQEYLPGGEALVEPAQAYAKQAALEISEVLNSQVNLVDQLIQEMQKNNAEREQSLSEQGKQINHQLMQTALTLEKQMNNLESQTVKINDLNRLQSTLTQNLTSLEKTGKLSETLMELTKRVEELKPILNKLQRPRRIMVVDMEENESA